jgi:hypothetical protein
LVDLPLKIIAITITTTTTIKIPTPTPVLNISPMAWQLLKKIEMKARVEYGRYFFIFKVLSFLMFDKDIKKQPLDFSSVRALRINYLLLVQRLIALLNYKFGLNFRIFKFIRRAPA